MGEFLDHVKESIDSVVRALDLDQNLEHYLPGNKDASAVAIQIKDLDCLMNESQNRTIVLAFKIGARLKEYRTITQKSFAQIAKDETERESAGQEWLFPKWSKDRMKRYSAMHVFILKYRRFLFSEVFCVHLTCCRFIQAGVSFTKLNEHHANIDKHLVRIYLL